MKTLIIKNKNVRIGDYIELEIPLPLKGVEPGRVSIEHPLPRNDVSESGLYMIDEPKIENDTVFIKLVGYKAGKAEIPSFTIRVDGQEVLQTPATGINVEGAQGKIELIDIKGPREINLPVYYYIGYGLLAALLLYVLWHVYKRFFKSKKSGQVTAGREYVSPYQRAMAYLSKIEMDTEIKKDLRLYVTKVSEVLRRFVEEEYGIAIMELTTTEMMKVFRHKKLFDPEITAALQKYFVDSDLVKFAENRTAELNYYNQHFIDDTRKFVNRLRVIKDEV
ncbi:MAG: hypothetical protein JXA66_07380 [Oligoflexia bacterium]|nr:hypothetical protein [Oligoflexia bacterium]